MFERDREIYCRACFNRGPGAVPPPVNSTAQRTEDTYTHRQPEPYSSPAAPAKPQRGPGAGSAPQPEPYTGYTHRQPSPHTPPRTGYTHRPRDYSPSSVFSSGRRSLNLPAPKDTCPRCTKPIYHAEKVVGPGGPWHRACFKCRQCSTTLDSTKLTEHDGEAFCRTCYTRLFSPRGYNIGGSTEPLPYQHPPRSPSDRAEGSARAPSSLAAYGRSSPGPSQWADDPAHNPFGSVVGAAASAAVQGKPRAHFDAPTAIAVPRPETPRSRLPYGRQHTPAAAFGMPGPPPDLCPRCSTRIYAAEQGMAA
ncbi:hypothetical protein GGF43_007008, partial [Coemansia sp. RSA 2618]